MKTPYLVAACFALVLLCGFQHLRLEACQLVQQQAEVESIERGQKTAQEATDAVHTELQANDAAVDTVVRDIAADCLQHPAGNLPVPAGAAVDAGRDAAARKSRVVALQRDIRTCARELAEKRAIVDWIKANSVE